MYVSFFRLHHQGLRWQHPWRPGRRRSGRPVSITVAPGEELDVELRLSRCLGVELRGTAHRPHAAQMIWLAGSVRQLAGCDKHEDRVCEG